MNAVEFLLDNVRALAPRLSEEEAQAIWAIANSRASFRQPDYAERKCDRCDTPYRGPSVYCSHACAVADAY